jgi:hypothetical protein
MATLEFQVRAALDLMARYTTVNRADLSGEGIGQKTIDALLDHGLIAISADLAGRQTYTLTEKGKAQAALPPLPTKPKRKPRLKALQPRVKELEPRIKLLR